MCTINFKILYASNNQSYRVEKNDARARASLRLPGTGERERRGNTEPFEGLFSRPDIAFFLVQCYPCPFISLPFSLSLNFLSHEDIPQKLIFSSL